MNPNKALLASILLLTAALCAIFGLDYAMRPTCEGYRVGDKDKQGNVIEDIDGKRAVVRTKKGIQRVVPCRYK